MWRDPSPREDEMNEMGQDTDREAYDRGAAAFGEGKMAEDNPYVPGSPGHKLWEHGYLDAQKAGHRQARP
jgi:hypothetical protein